MEAQETHAVAAMREVMEEAGVKGHIDRCLGVFQVFSLIHTTCIGNILNLALNCQNEERRTRTAVYVLIVTEEMPEWDDSKNIGKS